MFDRCIRAFTPVFVGYALALLVLLPFAAPARAQIPGQIPPNQFLAGPPSGATPALPTPRTLVPADVPFTQAGTGAVARTVDAKLKEGALSIKDFGALCDGATDDTAAINTADAAAAAAGKALYFPAGTCVVQGLNPVRSNLVWYGDGPYQSTIKMAAGSAFDTLVWFGPRVATTQIFNIYVHDLGFYGNSLGSNAVVEARNVTFSRYNNLYISQGAAAGFRTDTSTTTINTITVRNHYVGIELANNAGKGFYLNGEKDSEVAEIFSHNNTGDGIYFGPANLNSSALCETTQLYGGHLSARDNGGDGVVFDEAEKFALSSIQTSINAGYGIRFKSTFTGCGGTGSNSVNIGTLVARNDTLGAFRISDGAYVFGAKFGTVWIRGDQSTVGTVAMQLDGVSHTQFGSVQIEGWPGTAVLIQQGTPLGVTTQSGNLQFSSLTLMNNGNAGAGTNHGLSVLNNSLALQIGQLNSANLQTSGTNFELNVASTVAQLQITSAIINATTAGVNELSIGTSDTYIALRRTGANNLTLNNAPWKAFVPALSCGTATFTVNSARSMTNGKITNIQIDFTITAIGTCTKPVTFTLPNTANSSGALAGNVDGDGLYSYCQVAGASATATCNRGGLGNFIVNNHIVASGVYENQ